MIRPNKEILAEIARLKEILPRVPEQNGFNENNPSAIKAQIKVLSTRMSWDSIHDEWTNDQSTLDAAIDAHYWLTREGSDEPPSKEWEEIVENQKACGGSV